MLLPILGLSLAELEEDVPEQEIAISLNSVARSKDGLDIELRIENLTDSMLLFNSPKSSHGFKVISVIFTDSSGGEIKLVRAPPSSTGGIRFATLKRREVRIHKYRINLEEWYVVKGLFALGDANKVKVVFNSPKMGGLIDTGVKVWAGRVSTQTVETDFFLNEIFPSEFTR